MDPDDVQLLVKCVEPGEFSMLVELIKVMRSYKLQVVENVLIRRNRHFDMYKHHTAILFKYVKIRDYETIIKFVNLFRVYSTRVIRREVLTHIGTGYLKLAGYNEFFKFWPWDNLHHSIDPHHLNFQDIRTITDSFKAEYDDNEIHKRNWNILKKHDEQCIRHMIVTRISQSQYWASSQRRQELKRLQFGVQVKPHLSDVFPAELVGVCEEYF